MAENSKICKLLIVDNDVEYAKKVAFELEQIRPDLLQNHALEIEITNTAYFVVNHLENHLNSNPPWDIILSDLYMPIPSTPLNRNTAIGEAHLRVTNHKDKKWNFWEYEYTWNSYLEGTPEHGGIYIAQKVKALKETCKQFGDLKVILISDKLIDQDARDRIYEILNSEKSWFNYYDKANWENETENWPTHLNEPDVFRWAVIHAINERTSESWGDSISSPNDTFLVVSKAMKEIVIKCKTLGKDKNVNRILITGERGIGKSATARLLHEMRMKAFGLNGQLVTVECTSISDELFESGLFGHIKGAFTGADVNKIGFVETAKNGTLFFDEIGDLSPANQGKVLRLLQEGQFIKVGGNENIPMEAKLVIFATNKNLEQLIEEALFRADLYDRMNPPPINIPPLRDRREEIIPLAEHFIISSGKALKLSGDAREFLQTQNLEGNVRQLKNTIFKATTFCTSREIREIDLQKAVQKQIVGEKIQPTKASINNFDEIHESKPEDILAGKIKWASIQRKPYQERAAVMIVVKAMWEGRQNQLAHLLEVEPNNLEKFFSTLKKKIKNKELVINDVKPYTSLNSHPLLEKFFTSILF